jgi:hypothetical protein
VPPLQKPQEVIEVQLKPRTACLAAEAEVLVVGGGPSGLAAAVGAAQSGVRTILAERYGFLGGNATAALVMPLMSAHTQRPQPEKKGASTYLPTDHGEGEAVVAGVLPRFLEKLVRAGGAIPPSLETGYVVPFDPEIFKLVALELLDDAGVDFLFHAFASDLVLEPDSVAVIFETKSGPVIIRAQCVVDCTGDGDLASRAGAPFEVGREDGLVQPMTLMFRMAEFEHSAFDAYARDHPDQWRGVHGLWDLISQATAKGELRLPREDILFFGTPHPREVSVNSTRITKVLGTDVWDLSYAEWEGRRQAHQIAAFLRRYVPGFEQSYLVQSGVTVGVRETRRIVGDYQLTADDVLSARKFPDVIARGAYPIDVHNPAGKGTVLKRLPPGEAYDIPLRCLLPQGIERLLLAGRCVSGTHEAHSSYRVTPIAMATGHAAGVCAALAATQQKTPREVSVRAVQDELLRQGADLGR